MTKKKKTVKKKRKRRKGLYKYKDRYAQDLIDFFSYPPYREVEVEHASKNGDVYHTYEERPHDLPFFSAFARKIGVTMDTLIRWSKDIEKFAEAYKVAKGLQKEFLVTNSLRGLYNAKFAYFTAKNVTNWRDHKDVNIGGQKDNPVSIDVKKMSVSELGTFIRDTIQAEGDN
jgi:hypothetical protein